MKEIKKEKNKQYENIIISQSSFSNEIKLIRRTLENNTHEVYEDLKIKKITSWRKSQNKFLKNLIYNILSFGILHLFSLCYPRLYLKLYCNPWPAKECDYFLVENIYGEAILCPIQKKREKLKENNNSPLFHKHNLVENNNNINSDFNNNQNLKYGFEYKSMKYEYNEKNNEIIPVYMNLSKMTNEGIINFFGEGLSSAHIVENITQRYGKNEYNLNIKLYLILFLRYQIPIYAFTLFVEMLEYYFLFNYINLVFKIIIIVILVNGQILYMKIGIMNKYKKEFTLDGDLKKIKVKRKYLIKDEEHTYTLINNVDILPGDIIFLKQNDYVPCDCIILEGECIVSQSDLKGNLDINKKVSLKRTNKNFNYKYSNINILYHGMKIVRTYSKSYHGDISVLCINTGANTFKANQFSNTLYFLTRKNEQNNYYNTFNERSRVIIYMIVSFTFVGVFGYFVFSSFVHVKEKPNLKKNLPIYMISMLCKSFMTYFFITKNILIFLNIYLLYKEDITCFDLSRLINLGKINKILFNKTETLTDNFLTIHGYHPISFSSAKKNNNMKFINYSKEESKKLNFCLFEYYQSYLKNNINESTFYTPKKNSNYLIENKFNKSEENITLYLECLLSCNSVENYNFELFGNNLEIELFNDMKWDIKQYEENNNNSLKIKFFKEVDINNLKIENKNNYNNKYYFIIKKIIDIFPDNYYKLTESSNNTLNKTKIKMTGDFSLLNDSTNNQSEKINTNDNTYKLRIYKKFISYDGLVSAAVVHNFLTNEIRFFIKGIPEELINKCDRKTIPVDFEKVISYYRKNGFIVLILATKLLNIGTYEEEDGDDIDYYLDDLCFCGILTLENRIKDKVKNSIEKIKKLNDNLLIVSDDNEYNCLSIAYNSGIIEDKNIFILDKDETNNNKITIKKISSIFTNKEEETKMDITKATNYEQYSRVATRIESRVGTKISKNRRIKDNNINNNLLNAKSKKKVNENIKKGELIIPEINQRDVNPNLYQNRSKNMRKITNEIGKDNSEIERIIKRQSNIEDVNYIDQIDNYNNITNQKSTKKDYKGNIDHLSKNIQNLSQESLNNKTLAFMEMYYYHNSYEEYEDVKKGIYCINGKLFRYLFKNRQRKGIKKFLDKLNKKCKIYYNMSSIDKSMLVDYFRNDPSNIVCSIGQCENDIDSIISSNIGINLKNPKNQNTILCHFYSSKNDIICIKDLIETGRLLFENINVLEFISFIYSIIINSFIFCSLIRDYDILKNAMDFLEIEFFVLIITSFLGKSNRENIYIDQNSRLLTIYYAVICLEIILIKFISLYIFCQYYLGDLTLGLKERNEEFLSIYFILCSEFILTTIFAFNFASFYKESPFENRLLVVLTLAYLLYLTTLVFLCSSNISYDFLKITSFIRNEKLMDSFTDLNKIFGTLSVIIDISGTFIICLPTKLIFGLYLK